jgi:hypothetical protein
MQSFPLLALSLILFAGFNLTAGDTARPWYRSEVITINQMSGDIWHISGGDVFLSFSMFLLFIEILRSTRSGGESIVNHAFSALVFVGALMLFLTRQGYGNSVFFIFMSMTLLDFMAGFIITAVAARRDTTIGSLGR